MAADTTFFDPWLFVHLTINTFGKIEVLCENLLAPYRPLGLYLALTSLL